MLTTLSDMPLNIEPALARGEGEGDLERLRSELLRSKDGLRAPPTPVLSAGKSSPRCEPCGLRLCVDGPPGFKNETLFLLLLSCRCPEFVSGCCFIAERRPGLVVSGVRSSSSWRETRFRFSVRFPVKSRSSETVVKRLAGRGGSNEIVGPSKDRPTCALAKAWASSGENVSYLDPLSWGGEDLVSTGDSVDRDWYCRRARMDGVRPWPELKRLRR